MAFAVRVYETGGPEVLKYEEVTLPEPGAGEVRVKQTAIGLNFIDTYFRTGLYKPAAYPFIPGNEGAGVVVSVGKGVKGFKKGVKNARRIFVRSNSRTSLMNWASEMPSAASARR